MDIVLNQAQTLLLAMGVFFLGTFLHSVVYAFRKFNIPEPVIGGLVFALVLTVLYQFFDINLTLDNEIRDDLMLTFFATVGMNAKFSLFKKGGSKLMIFFFVCVLYLFIQNLIGVSLSALLGVDLHLGMLASSITLSGGHGTGASYATKFTHIDGALEVAMACATMGLVLGGIIGGPVSEWLISKHKLAPEDKVNNPDGALKEHGFNEPELVTTSSVLQVLLSSFASIFLGTALTKYLAGMGIDIPSFISVLFIGIIITNLFGMSKKLEFQQQSLDLVNMISLSLFLSIAMMSLKLWQLLDMAIPLFIIIGVQTVSIIFYTIHVTFRLLGKDYQAATIVSGHCGFGLGATPTALANIESVTNRYGPSPYGMFIVLIVGAFFIDIANAAVIQIFLSFIG